MLAGSAHIVCLARRIDRTSGYPRARERAANQRCEVTAGMIDVVGESFALSGPLSRWSRQRVVGGADFSV